MASTGTSYMQHEIIRSFVAKYTSLIVKHVDDTLNTLAIVTLKMYYY